MVVVTILGVLASVAAPAARRAADLAATRAARDATAMLLARARSEARGRGGAHVSIDLERGRAALLAGRPGAGGEELTALELGRGFGVRLDSRGVATGAVQVAFDGYGIGRVASRTLRFRPGRESAWLTVSSYGRVRRW